MPGGARRRPPLSHGSPPPRDRPWRRDECTDAVERPWHNWRRSERGCGWPALRVERELRSGAGEPLAPPRAANAADALIGEAGLLMEGAWEAAGVGRAGREDPVYCRSPGNSAPTAGATPAAHWSRDASGLRVAVACHGRECRSEATLRAVSCMEFMCCPSLSVCGTNVGVQWVAVSPAFPALYPPPPPCS